MSDAKPLILCSHSRGPVPWRVAILLEELKVPYESRYLDSSEMNSEPFKSLNPNAKTPAIEDPNTGIRLFEVGYVLVTYVTLKFLLAN
jgi:glutathione S-transferase